MEHLLVDFALEYLDDETDTLILDADTTDFELHGDQEDKFYHGYYDHHCYLPRYIFAGDWLFASRLRRAEQDASKGTLRHLKVIVTRLKSRYPDLQIVIRGDSGFARDHILSWCEEWEVDFVIGVAKNNRLKDRIEEPMAEAKAAFEESGEPSRFFVEFDHETLDSWS